VGWLDDVRSSKHPEKNIVNKLSTAQGGPSRERIGKKFRHGRRSRSKQPICRAQYHYAILVLMKACLSFAVLCLIYSHSVVASPLANTPDLTGAILVKFKPTARAEDKARLHRMANTRLSYRSKHFPYDSVLPTATLEGPRALARVRSICAVYEKSPLVASCQAESQLKDNPGDEPTAICPDRLNEEPRSVK